MATESWDLREDAEAKAVEATQLDAFNKINLVGIKRTVCELLTLFGKNMMFQEYTVHDARHINKMVNILNWIVPNDTKEIMSAADWLLAVLSIYFHDLGLIVTEGEYEARYDTDFNEFKNDALNNGPYHLEYRSKVLTLGTENAERFLYQEFVRKHHATRVRKWIDGSPYLHLGAASELVGEIKNLLSGLPNDFRRDLGLICESHHSESLGDISTFKLSQPYGDSDAETANLQYAALVLRTADLLHITQDRAPSVTFRAINPRDPISQDEWWKQNAVKRVMPKPLLDSEGKADPESQSLTVEVYATFEEPLGFFGLTSYLAYCQEQLRKSSKWAEEANRVGSSHKFPWRHIDDSNIEAIGFMKNSFEFTFDQEKVLDLLTGHMLYNDSSVVLRELVQNSLDAVRVQQISEGSPTEAEFVPSINIYFDSKTRTLSVKDNGTGMTQEVIEKHLLKVGSSRYQDEDFLKAYPSYNSISRFGIGVLTTFMVSDEVEIYTKSEKDSSVRQITFRGVHGKYLIQLVDPNSSKIPAGLSKHGTLVKLILRPSSSLDDIDSILQNWIIIPGCSVTLHIDDNDPVSIGHSSAKTALLSEISHLNKVTESVDDPEQGEIRVFEKKGDGLEFAYAARWSAYFNSWSFLTTSDFQNRIAKVPRTGICVEGIRVTSTSPGFDNDGVIALANSFGRVSPKTNVARSGLEDSAAKSSLTERIYGLYCDHIEDEIRDMREKRGRSLAAAVSEATYNLTSLLRYVSVRKDKKALENAVSSVRFYILDDESGRHRSSQKELHAEKSIWTMDSPVVSATSKLLKSIAKDESIIGVIKNLDPQHYIPDGKLLINPSAASGFTSALLNRKPERIVVKPEQRSVAVEWIEDTSKPQQSHINVNRRSRSFNPPVCYLVDDAVNLEGIGPGNLIVCDGFAFVLTGSPLYNFLLSTAPSAMDESSRIIWGLYLGFAESTLNGEVRDISPERLSSYLSESAGRPVQSFPFKEAADAINGMPLNCVFRVTEWSRQFEEAFW